MIARSTLTVAVLLLGGCNSVNNFIAPEPGPVTAQYHAEGYSWAKVRRVLVVPLANESMYTRANEEIGKALAAELQQLGKFEVVAPPAGRDDRLGQAIHRNGRFNEILLIELAKASRADVVIYGTITQYSPYPRPRLGLVLQTVCPTDGKAVASVDGLWDATQRAVETRAKIYYKQLPEQKPWLANHKIAPDNGHADELALESPYLFQRFVCHEAVQALTTDGPAKPKSPPPVP